MTATGSTAASPAYPLVPALETAAIAPPAPPVPAAAPEIAHGWARLGGARGMRVHYLVARPATQHPFAADENDAPLLLLHGGGLGSAALTYELSLAALAARRPVLAVDWPGYGASDKPADAPYTTDWYMHVLGGLLDALGVGRVHLCGLSMGGGVALGFALAQPRRVGRLVLVNSHGLGQEIPCRPLSLTMARVRNVNTLSWGGLREWGPTMRRGLRGVLCDPDAITDDLVRRACDLVRDGDTARAWWAWQRSELLPAGFRTDFSARLRDLAVPTLLLHSAGDRIVPLRYAARAAARIPHARLRVFHECGHWLPRERPVAFAAAVDGFLTAA